MTFTSINHRIVRRAVVVCSFLAAFIVLLIVPGIISAQEGGDDATEGAIWSADMLVVEYTSVSIGAASPELFSNQGGSAGLEAQSLWSYTPGRKLYLRFTEVVPGDDDLTDDLTLEVGNLRLPLQPGDINYTWQDVDVDWEDGQTIAVRIIPTSALVEPTSNSPATGVPTISGTAQVGETLTVDTSGIGDSDGLDQVAFSYQWIRNNGSTDADIQDATSSDYTLVDADEGKTVKVRVSFTDDQGNGETISSEASAEVAARPNSPATGAPAIIGTAQVGEMLTANTANIADEDGLDNATFSYQWIANDGTTDTEIGAATGSGYTLSRSDLGKTVKVRVSFTDDAGHQESVTSLPVGPVDHGVSEQETNSPSTGQPAINGTAQVREILTANTSGIADADGLTSVSYSYQWTASNGTTDTDIQAATGSTFTPPVSDVGKTIKVRVSFTDDAGNEESLTSAATAPVAATVPTEPLGLTVSRGSQIRELDASWQAPSSNGGSTITGYKLQWKESADNWDTATDVSEATATVLSHTITGLTGGVEYTVRVIATNGAGDGPASVEATGTPAGGTSQQNLGDTTAPTISSIAITSDTSDEDSLRDDDGIYGIGDRIEVTVTFDEDVTVTGSPQLELTIGSSGKNAAYKSTTDSMVVFSYTVAVGDSDTDGISIGGDKLTLNGGSIKDAADNPANLTHPALDAQNGHRVDGIRPTISSVSVSAGNDGVHTAGEELTVLMYFNEEVIVTGTPQWLIDSGRLLGDTVASQSSPYLEIDLQGTAKRAYFSTAVPNCLPDTATLCFSFGGAWEPRGALVVFAYKVENGDLDLDGVGIGANKLSLNGETIKDAAGNDAVLTHSAVAANSNIIVDAVPATIRSVAITSNPGSDKTYSVGDTIEVTVTFSEAVRVPQSRPPRPRMPRLELNIGDVTRFARTHEKAPITGTAVVFSYTVQDSDNDPNGISIGANKLALNGGTIKDAIGTCCPGGSDANLAHSAVADDAEHKVGSSMQQSLSTDATLKELTLSGIDFGAFASGTESYTAAVPYSVYRTAIIPSVNHSGARYVTRRGGIKDSDGIIYLATGSNVITVEVTAEDGQTTKTYTVTVTREAASTDASLKWLSLIVGVNFNIDYGPFQSDTESYTATVAYSVSQTRVWPATNHPRAGYVIKIGGVPAPATYFREVLLATGINVITVEVTAEDGQTTKTYTVTVTREAASTDATLKGLTLSGVDFGAFSSGTESYTVDVTNSPTETTVTPTANHSGASYVIRIGGVEDDDGTVSLAAGSNVITIEVTAEDGQTAKTYTVTVTRLGTSEANVASPDATLSGLTLSGIDFGTFESGTKSYTAQVANGVSQTTVTPTTNDSGASYVIKLGGVTHPDGTLSLAVGINVITVEVTAKDGETAKTYTVTVQRQNAEPVNAAPTGLPTISGTSQVGETLTAYTSGIADEDGLTNSAFTFQWIAGDADIPAATGSTYTPRVSDFGKTIRVRVSFSDDKSNAETLTSEPTAAVIATVSTQPLGLTVTKGDQIRELDASWQAPASNGGSAITGYKVQWKEDADSWSTAADVSEVTANVASHTITGLTGGVEYAVRVIATNGAGDGPASSETTGTPAGGVSQQNNEPENNVPTGLPTISGTAQVDETLTADTSGISDADGLTNVSYSYQWIADGADIDGATSSTYKLSNSEVGKTIQVKVSFTDNAENQESLTSAATAAVEARPNPLTGFTVVDASAHPQTVLAALTAGDTLTLDDPANGSYGIRVNIRSGTDIGSVRLQLTGGKSVDQTEGISPYSLYGDNGESDLNGDDLPVGSYTLTATAYSEGGLGGEELGILTVPFTVAKANNPATGAPTISGTAQAEQTLTASTSGISDTDGLGDVSYSYQWLAGGSDIDGATSSTYKLTDSEVGKTIQVRVSFTDDADNQESLTSPSTSVVSAKPTPLTASKENVAQTHDGKEVFTFELRFSEHIEDLSYVTLRDDHAFTVTGGKVKKAQRMDRESETRNIHWRITVEPNGNGDVTIVLPVTTDCNATGAICTADGRKLSNRLEFTVSGPGG